MKWFYEVVLKWFNEPPFLENEKLAAFRALAFKRFKNAPLYLEWAPVNALLPPASSAASSSASSSAEATSAPESLDEIDSESCTLFVKNGTLFHHMYENGLFYRFLLDS